LYVAPEGQSPVRRSVRVKCPGYPRYNPVRDRRCPCPSRIGTFQKTDDTRSTIQSTKYDDLYDLDVIRQLRTEHCLKRQSRRVVAAHLLQSHVFRLGLITTCGWVGHSFHSKPFTVSQFNKQGGHQRSPRLARWPHLRVLRLDPNVSRLTFAAGLPESDTENSWLQGLPG